MACNCTELNRLPAIIAQLNRTKTIVEQLQLAARIAADNEPKGLAVYGETWWVIVIAYMLVILP